MDRELRDELGVLMRLDLCYRGIKLAVEHDGRHHLTSSRQWERDVERRNDLVAQGWLLITVTSRGIHRTPEATLERIWQALQDRGWKPLRRPTDGWRGHFAA